MTPDRCTHSFPDPYPQPMAQPGNCRNCGISYQEAKDAAAMSTTTPDPEPGPDDEDDGPWCRTEQP